MLVVHYQQDKELKILKVGVLCRWQSIVVQQLVQHEAIHIFM